MADYDLGDRALAFPWFHGFGVNGFPNESVAPLELAGRVYYPLDDSSTPHPLVEIQHGLWYSCADRSVDGPVTRALAELAKLPPGHPVGSAKPAPDPRAAQWQAILDRDVPKLSGWPCPKGIPSLPSYRGYGYLGIYLASHGIIAVSIGENGANNGDQYQADRARAAVADRQLALWSELDHTGRGPLKGHFTRPGTDTPVSVNFQGRIDLSRVGLVGHSRGGRGVMWQAADAHRNQLPRHVTVRAAVTLAAAAITNLDTGGQRDSDYLTSRAAVLAWTGTCDGSVSDPGSYVTRMSHRPHRELVQLVVRGANHNFINTEWSPDSGQVQGTDDAAHPPGHPGLCRESVPHAETSLSGPAVRALTAGQERDVVLRYAGGFLLDQLLGAHVPLNDSTTTKVQIIPKSPG